MQPQTVKLGSGQELHTLTAGNRGPYVILIHGWTCRAEDWRQAMAALAEDFRLIAIDLPGHGESREVSLPDWSIRTLAKTVAETAAQVTSGPVTLVGHSMGGAVALEAPRMIPSVAGTILVDTFIIPYGDLPEEKARQIETPFFEDFSAAIARLVANSAGPAASGAQKARLTREMQEGEPAVMLPLWSDLLRWQPDLALTGSPAPIYAINGDSIPEPARQRCAPHVTEHRLAGAGHFPQLEMPEKFNESLRQILLDLN